ncbi:metal-dependent transcriptional regulator [Aquimarina sp. ERC-38]|uniref:metal-dependent transcriptional regulator n=1 Tax=Aquimarina sp. ERC-38 TaxID=2949996 RepID=UPI0022468E9B|nr:metal-dependent transcriptional regulator [Aquimarina sp. ERC-38]UZO79318.1 metal-dependent transcriptional regulator [Aquimarina sp. ERC-38]
MTNKSDLNNLTKSEEDYLKALFQLLVEMRIPKVGNNLLASYLEVSPASANNMIKKLKQKRFVDSEKYSKLILTESGKSYALHLIRKHRLWETFLHQYLNFSWEEVHEVAEQLEHIKSIKLVNELDRFMKYPTKDPHGESIPDAKGVYHSQKKISLSSLTSGDCCRLIAVNDDSVDFLQYLNEIKLSLTDHITVIQRREFDGSMKIQFREVEETISQKIADYLFVSVVS